MWFCGHGGAPLRRFAPEVDAVAFSHELWMLGHGACMLFVTGVMSFEQVEPHVRSGLVRLYCAAGDDPELADRSLAKGWVRGLDAG